MRLRETTHWAGNVRIIVCRLDGDLDVLDLKNQIQAAGVNMLRDALQGLVTDLQIKYLAWGTDATANTGTMTQLVAESGRKAVTLQTSGSAGVAVSTSYLSPFDAVGVAIKELGWFAGALTTATPNSGIMVARTLYSHTKTNLENITVIRQDTLAGV